MWYFSVIAVISCPKSRRLSAHMYRRILYVEHSQPNLAQAWPCDVLVAMSKCEARQETLDLLSHHMAH